MLFEMMPSPDDEQPDEHIVKLTDVDDSIAYYSFSIMKIIQQEDGSTEECEETIKLKKSQYDVLKATANLLMLEGVEDVYVLMLRFAVESTPEDLMLFRKAPPDGKIEMLKVFLDIRNGNDPSEFTIEDWTPERDEDENY